MTAYRPISLLTSFSKIFEKVIYNRLLLHTDENKIIARNQYGFKNNSSTELAMYTLLNHILLNINSKALGCGIFCDLTKAFDTVNHGILMSKLEYYGVGGKMSNLIRSYLSNRYQRVAIKSLHNATCTSARELVKHGVSQGSIFGPLLFLFYINDLPQLVEDIAFPVLYDDDTSFLISNDTLEGMNQDVKQVLHKTHKWFRTNVMLLNCEKAPWYDNHRDLAIT